MNHYTRGGGYLTQICRDVDQKYPPSLTLPTAGEGIALWIINSLFIANWNKAASFLMHWSYSWKTLFFSYPDTTCHNLFVALPR
jgi:hypothetical protein